MENMNETNSKNEISLGDLFFILWRNVYLIISITISFSIISIIYSLSLPNIYKSEALLMPNEVQSSMSAMPGQYSNMASLAGISLPSETSTKSQEAIARIRSFEFFSNEFLPNIALEDLLAVKDWDISSNKLIYNDRLFDNTNKKWVRKVEFPQDKIPSAQEAYPAYLKILNLSQDNKTSFISVSLKHISPHVAKQWVDIIIEKIDTGMRNQDKAQAERSIEYLNSIALTTNYEEIKKSLNSLQEEQMKRLMIIESNENYVFSVLDSPIAAELKSEPRRSLIVIVSSMLGFVLSVILILIAHYRKSLSWVRSN